MQIPLSPYIYEKFHYRLFIRNLKKMDSDRTSSDNEESTLIQGTDIGRLPVASFFRNQ
jgi:hypothetical protein